jgi:hypothetical protein
MIFRTAIACGALLGLAASASAQSVSLQFENGLVTLNAQNAPLRSIFAEWARIGGTRIVNGDRLAGPPVSLELNGVPERQALEILLRSAAGYVVTQREGNATGASAFGGVVILATSNAPRGQAPVTFSNPTVQPRAAFDDNRDDQEADERPTPARPPVTSPFSATPGVTSNPPQPVVIRPGAAPFPQEAQPAQPAQPQRPSNMPQTLPGTSRPGEITPPPPQQQPNQK